MVVERVAARPVDEAGVRVAADLAVELVLLPRGQQHVGDPSRGDRGAHGVDPHRQARGGERVLPVAHRPGRPVPEAEAAAGPSDLPEHRRERQGRPERSLSVVGALERPGHGDHRPVPGHAPGELADRLRGDAGDLRRPVGVLGGPVLASVEVVPEPLPAHAAGGEEPSSWRPSVSRVCPSPSMSAVSVFGRIGGHCGSMKSGASSLIGETETNARRCLASPAVGPESCGRRSRRIRAACSSGRVRRTSPTAACARRRRPSRSGGRWRTGRARAHGAGSSPRPRSCSCPPARCGRRTS